MVSSHIRIPAFNDLKKKITTGSYNFFLFSYFKESLFKESTFLTKINRFLTEKHLLLNLDCIC